VTVGDRVYEGGGLNRRPRDPRRQIARACDHPLNAARYPRPGVTVNTAGGPGMMRGGQIDRGCIRAALNVGSLWL
jgi:hypothetical protein